MPPPALIAQAELHRGRTAVVEVDQTTHSYGHLLDRSASLARAFLRDFGDLNGKRVAFLVDPSAAYVAVQWAIWRSGAIAVPLATMHPREELAHVIADSEPEFVVVQPSYLDRVAPIAQQQGLQVVVEPELSDTTKRPLPDVALDHAAMIVYTSGSTGKPKGVLTTHANIESQITSLVTAWEWSTSDTILLTLPLHHVHGIINVLGCCLWSGATCHIHARFDAAMVWRAFLEEDLTLFMAVPTIYRRLIEFWNMASPQYQNSLSKACAKFRLMVSGSAALPQSTLDTWRRITGHTLLERYGMTEIGMALANPLHGERRRGCVGTALPLVNVKLVADDGGPTNPGETGEIFVSGPLVFQQYWRRPTETTHAFEGNWFKTGDVAVVEDGYYRIVGRRSVDIIKTGGYKVSALEIEEVLRTHPGIDECAVVGLEDNEWGERVAVAIEATSQIDINELRGWARDKLAPYKIPTTALTVTTLPRNAMGKVVKSMVVTLFQESR